MKHPLRKSVTWLALAILILLGSGCRGMQINSLEKRVAQLETRVAVLESQAAMQPHK